MNEIRCTRHVAAPPSVVWDVITDLDATPRTIRAIEAVERHDSLDGFVVGTRWTETRTMFGRQATETMEVTELDPGASYVVEADGAGAHYRSVFRVEPEGEGALVHTSFGAEPTGLVSRVMAATVGRLFAGATRKAIAADLDDIAAEAESRA